MKYRSLLFVAMGSAYAGTVLRNDTFDSPVASNEINLEYAIRQRGDIK